MKKIILASQSPRRKTLLLQIGLKFEIDVSNYEEDMGLDMKPLKLAEFLSLGKAEDVAKRHKDAIIISADTIVAVDDEVFGKPKTPEKAKYMLQKLSGRSHSVITGFTIINTETNKQISKSVETKVYFKKLSEEEINAYIATGEPLDKGGGYAIQGLAALFVEKIVGDYFNIVGLPILALTTELKNFGINVLEKLYD
ncbi:MAG: nucleoside triphosphate pyrophosphatase [Candidatus Staskawiczbacteria bacterium]|nr:nucleoside triphosphate pyrophosphatase [Candidatus Staskawiczbacteria bacterium]